MKDRLNHLLEEARQEPHLGRPNWSQYGPVVHTLREKTWSYRRIFDWLVARGEPLDPAMFSRFRVAISTRASRQRKLSEAASDKAGKEDAS